MAQTFAAAQSGDSDAVRDFQTWSSLRLGYKVNKRLTLSLNQQLRLKDNSSTVDEYFTQLKAKYDFKNGIYFAGGLRFIRENDDQGKVTGYENHLRWQTDFGYEHNVERLELDYRLRYQQKNELGVTETNSNNTARVRIQATYNIKKWKFDPMFSSELFRDLEGQSFRKLRVTLGSEYDSKKAGTVSAFYRLERELQGSSPMTIHIAGIEYQFNIK